MKYEIQRFIENTFRSGEDGSSKKVILLSATGVLLLVAVVLIGRSLFFGGTSLEDRQPGIVESNPEMMERVEKEGYIGGSQRVAPGYEGS